MSKTTVYEKKTDGRLFPLGQVVPNIDERVRVLENQINEGDMGYVVKPVITDPTDGNPSVTTLVQISGNPYRCIFTDELRSVRRFQVATDPEFTQIVKEGAVDADSWRIDAPQLSTSTTYYARIRDESVSGWTSFWSNTVSFTTSSTAIVVDDPVITLKGYNDSPTDIGSGVTIEISPFSVSYVPEGVEVNHIRTDWSVWSTNPSASVWSSTTNDTTTSVIVPEGTFQKSTNYVVSVKVYSDKFGDSNIVSVYFTTSSDFGTVNTPTLEVEGAPTNVYETPRLTGGAFSNTREPDEIERSWFAIRLPNDDTHDLWSDLRESGDFYHTQVPKGILQPSTAYRAILVYKGKKFGDCYPAITNFTTVSKFAYVVAPTLTVEGGPDNVFAHPVLTSGAFSTVGEDDTHIATEWRIEPDNDGTEPTLTAVWERAEQTASTSTTVDGGLQAGTSYVARVRYQGQNLGWSSWTSTKFTTVPAFAAVSTPVISGNTTNVMNTQVFTASAFSMTVGGPGNHDVTDWVLVKADAPSVEIWSSKNDSVNKTQCPSLSSVLEVSTNYILKVRYHDSTNDIWSDYGQLAFTTASFFTPTFDIGTPGTIGFGVGICDDTSGLAALGLAPMEGYADKSSDNYGNYQHANGIVVFIPAWCYKFTNSWTDDFEIKSFKDFNFDEATANSSGYILHRAFIDGGKPQKGFFVSKYLLSKGFKSVKNETPLSCSSSTYASVNIVSELGESSNNQETTIIKASKKFDSNFNCITSYMFSALAMLALCQAKHTSSSSTNICAWRTSTNYGPRGCNNGSLKDVDDSSVTYVAGNDTILTKKPKTGSASNFAKTTHNGQNSGVCDLNGCMAEATLYVYGKYYYSSAAYQGFYLYYTKDSYSTHLKDIATTNDFTNSSDVENFYYKNIGGTGTVSKVISWSWDAGEMPALYKATNGEGRSLCGINPAQATEYTGDSVIYGTDKVKGYISDSYHLEWLSCGGTFDSGTSSGIWCRTYGTENTSSYSYDADMAKVGLRVGAYLP